MKKKVSLVLVLSFLMSIMTFAQQNDNKGDRRKSFEEMKAKRVAYITEKVGLTPAESEKFWPVYNELQEKKITLNREARKEIREKMKSKETLTEADYEKLININVDIALKEAQLDKEYLEKYKKILPAEKIYKLQRADKDFIKGTFGKYGAKGVLGKDGKKDGKGPNDNKGKKDGQ